MRVKTDKFNRKIKLSQNDIIPRLKNESMEIHQLKLLTRTDINMINAKKNFDRPLYHTKYFQCKEANNEK